MGVFDGSIHEITRASEAAGESDEGWSTAMSASGDRVLLQVYERDGEVARITLTAQQAWSLKHRLEYAALALTDRGMPNGAHQPQPPPTKK